MSAFSRGALFLALAVSVAAVSPRRPPASAFGRAQSASAVSRPRMLFGFGGPPPPQAAVTDRCFLDVVILSANGREKYEVGRLELGLFGDVAPACVARFKQLVSPADSGLPPLKGVAFHRTLKDFIVQSGKLADPQAFEPFAAEKNELVHVAGALSMSQDDGMCATEFFVTVNKAPECDGEYTVFGQVTSGFKEVIADINKRAGSSDGTPWVGYEITNCGLL